MPKEDILPKDFISKVKFCSNAWRAFSGLKSTICIFQQNLSTIMGFLINKKNWPKSANFWPNLYAFCKLRHRWCLLNDNLSPWTKWLVWHVVILGIMSFGHFIALGILSYLGQNVNLTLSILSYLEILSPWAFYHTQWRQTRWCHCSTCTTTFMPSPKFIV